MVVLLQDGGHVSVWKVRFWMRGCVLVLRVCFFMEDHAGNGGSVSVLRVCLWMGVSVSVWRVNFFIKDYAGDTRIDSVWRFRLGK